MHRHERVQPPSILVSEPLLGAMGMDASEYNSTSVLTHSTGALRYKLNVHFTVHSTYVAKYKQYYYLDI